MSAGTRKAGTAIAWFRRDLRLADLPMLAAAAEAARIVPAFVLDPRLLGGGRFRSPGRIGFMLGCLQELSRGLRERGGALFLREGEPEQEIPKLARETGAGSVHFTADVSPFGRARDRRVATALEEIGVRARAHSGQYVADDPGIPRTGQGRPYSVFGPYAKAWGELPRRAVLPAPEELAVPSRLPRGRLPAAERLGAEPAAALAFAPGEQAARSAGNDFFDGPIAEYAEERERPRGGTSRLSPYLRWGCLSPLELERRAARRRGEGPRTFLSELAWREFFASVMLNFPHVTRLEFQERFRGTLDWSDDPDDLEDWKRGRTGYPLVDAGMRQLLAEGWMHNRVRMVVGSFLTKDLHLDWRLGEAWFMERLLDGDMASNNGNWQWIASVGTDPAPYFQRLFNPMTQQERFDPEGEYVRRWVPELGRVPPSRLARPWEMGEEEQEAAGCRIGEDYPAPIVEHAEERRHAIERYRSASPG